MSETTGSRRFLKLASMTTSVMTRYARARMRSVFASEDDARAERESSYADAGRRIAETLGELKGAVMKIGQMASIGSDLLPPELSKALSKLQKEAPPVPFEVIEKQIESELGAPPERLFDRFDREPFAAASIGQVHRALTDDGREVVVKVQYPGIDASVDSDLLQLKFALRAAGLVQLERSVLNDLFAEVRARLYEELDYTNEAQNVRMFREFHENRGDDSLIVPEVVGERSAQRVLTLTYEAGDPISRASDLGYPQDVRDEIGRKLIRMFLSQVYELRAVHADPNPANFACRRDGSLVVYDFGCVKKLEPWILKLYRYITKAFLDEDYFLLDQLLLDLGGRNPKGPPVPPEVYRAGAEIFRPAFLDNKPFDFGNTTVHRQLLELAPEFRRHRASFQPPVAVVYVNRVLAGLAGNLRNLGARVALVPELEPYLESSESSDTIAE